MPLETSEVYSNDTNEEGPKTPGDLPGHPTQKMAQTHMGVSLNGGTPKTPQNDHV